MRFELVPGWKGGSLFGVVRAIVPILLSLFSSMALLGPRSAAQAHIFSAQPVGAVSTPVSMSVTIQHAGVLNAVTVVGQGNLGADFAAAGPRSCMTGLSYAVGQTCTVGVSFSPLYPGVRNGAVVLAAADGTVLGTQFLSGGGVGGLGTFVPGMMTTLAGQSTWLYSGDGGPATQSSIYLPFGIAVDSLGNVFIADYGNNRIRKVSAALGTIATIAGNGTIGGTGDGGPALQATMTGPASVALDGAGNIYFCDSGNDAIRKVDVSTGTISTVAGKIGQLGYSGDGKLATAATLNGPSGIAIDQQGNLYIADSANNVIRRVNAVNGIISTIAGTGTAGFAGDGGQAAAAQLNAPWSVTPIPTGGYYIADQGNNRIRMVDADGVVTTIVGTGAGDPVGDGGPAAAADLDSPANVVVDAAGNLYIADSGNNRIRKVNSGTGIISTVAGPGASNITGDYGPATLAVLSGPYTLALDGVGNLYIGDVFHNRVREVLAGSALLLYPPMRLGRVSPSQLQTLENDGNASVNLSTVQAVEDSVLDSAKTTCTSGTVLAPLNTCAIAASFAPTQLGSPAFGHLSIASDAVNAPGTLILEGQVLNQDPSTVSLSASIELAQAGEPIYFTATVTSAGVIPTGIVTLLDGGNAIGAATLGQGGVVTFTISNLTGGQHVMTVSYPGDSNNTAGESRPLIVVVQYVTAPTLTTLAVSVNPAPAGSPVTLTATVALVSAGTGTGTISGPVTFSDTSTLPATILGSSSVSNGLASLKLSNLTAGKHSIVASYDGTTSFGPSGSAPLILVILPATSRTALSSDANPSIGGLALALSATITSNGPNPTGSVIFTDGSATLGSATIGSGGIATLTVATLAVGGHTIVASYAGDSSNNGSISTTLAQAITLATTSVAVKSSANPAAQGAPVVFTASVSGNGGIPSGSAQFFDGAVSLGSAPLDRTGAATFSTAALGVGTHPITASYQGDPLDGPSVSAALVETIQTTTTAMVFTSGQNPSGFAASVTFSVTVEGTGTQPSGVVTLLDGASVLGIQTLDPNGAATFSYAGLAIGGHNLTAQYGGDATHQANAAKLTQTVLQVTNAVLVASAGTSIAGTAVTWTAVVAGLSGLPATGNIQFMDGKTAVATVPVGPAGTALFTSAGLAVGAHGMWAVYSGNSSNEPATSNAVPETVVLATTSVTLTSNANPAFAGANVILTAAAAGNGAVPGGTVTFRDGSMLLGAVAVAADGSARFPTTALAPGLHTVTAVYSGDANDSPAASATLAQEIVQQTVLTIASSANPSYFQNPITISVAVSGGAAGTPATGNIVLTDGATVLGTAAIGGTGVASFSLTAPALGAHVLVATYAGDPRYSPAASPAFTQTVTLRPTTTDLKTSATQLSAGQPVTFFAAVQGIGPNIPTGTVMFVNGAAVLGTATLDAAGVAVLTFNPPQGSDQVVAQYAGDALFAASNSLPLAVLVGPPIAFTISVTPTAVSIVSGAHTTLQVAIAVAPGFSDTLAIGCSGLPASATCTFSQDQVKVTSGSGQTISVVVDTGNPLGAGASARLSPEGLTSGRSGTALACILPGGILLGLLARRRRRIAGLVLTLVVAMMIATGALTGCGSLQVNATPAGSYTFQIVGTGGASGVTESATVALTVTQ